MNDLVTRNDNTNPANRPDAATYMSLFEDDQTRCAPGALMANNGRLAYLVHLKKMILGFEKRADTGAPITLQQRRPDLLALSLDEKNTRKVLPKIRMVLDVLESRAMQALPEQQSLQQAVANGLYQANVPFHHAWESIKATLANKQLHLWDVLRSTHASYPAFAFDNLPLADQRAATVLSSGFSPELQSQLLAPPLPPTPLMPDLASLSVAHLIEENRLREDELEEHLHRVSEPEERLHLEAELEKCRLREAELEDYRQQEAQLEGYQRQETEFYKRHFRISDSNPLGRLNTTQKLTKALGLSRRELRRLLAVNAIGEGNTSVTRSVLASVGKVAAPSSQVFGAAFINNTAAPLYLTERARDTQAAPPEATPAPAAAQGSAPVSAQDAPSESTPGTTEEVTQVTTQVTPPAPVQPAVKASASKPAKKTVAIIGLTSAHLDRLQRILRIQRALDLTATETDTLVMAALRAEGQTGDYHLTGTTLRALGMFSHLRQKYSVTPWQYAAFLDVISPYATGQQVSFYDKLFAPTHTDEGAPAERLLTLDDSPFDLNASQGDDALTVDQLALGMKVNREVLVIMLGWVCQAQGLQKPTRSLAVVSACYRMVTLLRLLGGSVAEGLMMLGLLMQEQPAYLDQLAGVPTLSSALDTPDIIDVIAGLINALEWQQHQKLDTLQVFALLHREQAKFQKNWACAFEADTFKPNPQLSPEPEKQDDDTQPEGGTHPEVIEAVPLSTVATVPQTAHDAKQPPRLKTDEEREAACYAALSQPLTKALDLETNTLVKPLLMWAGVDPQALYQRMLDIQQQLLTNAPLASLFLPSDLGTWSRLQRYSALIKLLKLSATAVKHFACHPAWFDLDLSHCETSYDYAFFGGFIAQDTQVLHFTTLYQLDRYNALLARLAEGKHEDDVLEYFKQANGENATAGTGDPWLALEDLLGLPRTRLSALNITTPPRTLRDLDRLLRLLALADKHRLSLATLLELGKLPQAQDYAAFEQTAIALRRGCSAKQRKALDAQLSVAWRDALMQWMIMHWVPGSTAPNWINSPQTLADYLLIDLQVSHEPLTTRTLSATASLQRYLHQIHSHLENGYRDVMITEQERDEWETFSSSYERWELRKSAHNEPQNYIDPTRRTRKTNAFKDLESLLAQGKCTPQDVQTALESYLSTFETLSNIQPISVYADGTSPMTDTYHFIGKTNVEPVEYYWRTLNMKLRNQDGAPSMLAWGEWEKITLGITGKLAVTPLPKEAPLLYVKGKEAEEEEKTREEAAKKAKKHEDERLAEDLRTHIELIRPVIIAGRRYAVWAEWGANSIPIGPDNKASDYYPLRVCFAFQQTDGVWSPPNELLLLDGHGPDGKFDPSVVPSVEVLNLKTKEKSVRTTPINGTAPGNVFLKTKDFQPGLMAMVNQMGGREHDPWFMVMLYDTQRAEYHAPNQDYFLVAKDLLLLESKMLDQVHTGYRPIEKKMVSNWLKFFHDPRTVQHPYVGASINLTEEPDENTLPSNEDIDPKYSVTKSGKVTLNKPTQLDNGAITLTYTLDGNWKTRRNYQSFEPLSISHTDLGEVGTVKATLIESFGSTAKPEDITKAINSFQRTHHSPRKIPDQIFTTLTAKHTGHQGNPNHPEFHLLMLETHKTSDKIISIHMTSKYIACLTDSNPSGRHYLGQNSHEPISFVIYTSQTNNITFTVVSEKYLSVKNVPLQTLTPITLTLSPLPSRYARFSATLTATPTGSFKPDWTLSSSDNELLNTPKLQALKSFSQNIDNQASVTRLKQSLLKVRYTTKNDFNLKMGLPLETGLDTRLSVHQAITKAREQNRLGVVDLYFKREADEIRKETSGLPKDIDLDAALRLRHFHPDACRRILLHIDPAHKMVFEDELIADGIDKLTFRCPINLDIRRYKFELKLKDGNDDLGTLTHEYSLVDSTDDAVPSVQLRRNDEQALYLDMEEVNAKCVTGQKALPNSLRLNTLFGKQLVALATQSVQRALSWEAQCLPEPRLEPGSYPSTVDFHSANGLYFWELFFHVPFLVAWLKRQNREYGEAWRSSTRHLFDPYRTWVPEGNHPPLYWLTQPLLGTPAFEADEKTSDPDELAYAAPERYQKALHLFVVENWQRQGDDLYRQLNLDTLVEAALCYDKALRLIGALPENLSTTPAQAKSLAASTTADFTPPLNNKLVELRNLLRNRLFNLRHGLTLDGKPAAIMLDPETLDRIALGYGGADQDRGKAGSIARTVPPCRYDEARKCAGEAVLQLIELGQTQLRLYERDASLQLSLASKANIIKLMDFPCRLRAQALELARRERDTVLASKRMVEGRHSYYQGLVDEGITDLEHASRAMACVSQISLHTSTFMALSANTVEAALPIIFGLAFGGQKPSKTIEQGAYTFKLLSEVADIAKHELRAQAEFELRSQQWQFEADQASFELQMLDKQLLEHDIRIKAASIAADEARATQAAHRAEYDIMTSVFANRPTNLWLIGRLSEIYASAYDATLSLCLMAEACLQYELGDFSSTWIKTDGWLDNWRSMLAGEALERDLMLMDVAAIRDNHRPLDIRKDLSLLACMKWTHEDLHAQLEGDEVLFTLWPWLFDQDYPGHYLRRIEKVSVSFKIDGTSSSDPMPAMLTQYSNKVLLTDDAEGARHLYFADQGNADNLLRDLRPHQSTAIWSMKEVARNFDLQPSVPDKARYQPFEGTGLLSSWKLSFPGGAKNNPLLYRNGEWLLEDITLQISYSAVDGTPEFGAKVKETLAHFKASVATEDADYATRAAAAQASLGAKKDIRKALKKALDTLKSAEAKAKLSADTAQTIRAGTPKAQLDDETSPAYQALKKAEDEAAKDKTEADKARIKVDALRQMEAKAATQALDAAKAKSLETVRKASEIILGARQAIETDGAADTFKTSEGRSRIGVVTEATAVLQTAMQTIERISVAIPNEASASGAASKAQEATEAARKALKAAEAVAQARKAAEAEVKPIADEAEAKRIADEAEAKRIADAAEAKRIADAAEAKRIADAAEAKRIADAAEAKRKAEEAAALIKPAQDAEQQALDDLKTVQADADAAKAVAPKLEGPAYIAQSILKRAQKAADQATTARKNAETAITNNEMDKAAAEVENAKQAAREVRTTVEKVAAARQAAESDKDAVFASAKALIGQRVNIYTWDSLEEKIKVYDADIRAAHEKYKSIDCYNYKSLSLEAYRPISDIVKIEAS